MEKLQINDRLFLERISLIHSEAIFHAIDENRNHLRQWLPFVDQTIELRDTERFVRSMVNTPLDERDDIYVIFYNYEFAGLIALKDVDRVDDKAEIGYWLVEHMTGKGLATESTRRLINIAFRDLNLNRIQIRCGVGNNKSKGIPERLGFRLEGIEREGEKHHHGFIDLEVYSMLKKDWIK